MKTLSYLYIDSPHIDKTIPWSFCLHDENPHTWKDGLYIEMGACEPGESEQWVDVHILYDMR